MLVECPECKKTISDQAISCPNCGYVLRKPDAPETPPYTPLPHNEGCFLQTMNIGCLVFFVLFFLSILFAHFPKSSESWEQLFLVIFLIVIGIVGIYFAKKFHLTKNNNNEIELSFSDEMPNNEPSNDLTDAEYDAIKRIGNNSNAKMIFWIIISILIVLIFIGINFSNNNNTPRKESQSTTNKEINGNTPPKSHEHNYIIINGVKWATSNIQNDKEFVQNKEEFGGYFKNHIDLCPDGWRLPTRTEFSQLVKDGGTWAIINGRKGRWYGGNHKTDKKGSIFLPAAGAADSYGNYSQNEEGYYWTSTDAFINNQNYGYAYCLVFPNDVLNKYNKNSLSSIRCVKK